MIKDMKRALEVINNLEKDGVISRYAIGGAMASIFYAEPVSTFDLDIFIHFAPTISGLINLEPLYAALKKRGYSGSDDHIEIEGVPVQFLPAYNALVQEALDKAVEVMYATVSTRVLRVEYLVAIALQTGRPKDRSRVEMLRAQAAIDTVLLKDILKRHELRKVWKLWTR